MKTTTKPPRMSETMQKAIFSCALCFTAGTKVLTDKGEKAIEHIQIGDSVLSQNEKGKQAYKPVTMLFRRTLDRTYTIRVGNETLTTSDEHPFWVEKKGWVKAKNLKAGDKLKTAKGKLLRIAEIRTQQSRAVVYNFTVADYHTYFVSNLGIWVHNTECLWIPGFKPLGRGSTGRSIPKNNIERESMLKVISDPTKGEILKMPSKMQDNRWSHKDGWVKMSRIINGVEIHWVYNFLTNEYDDFKFKEVLKR